MSDTGTITPEAQEMRERFQQTNPEELESLLKWHVEEAKRDEGYARDLVAALASLHAEPEIAKPVRKVIKKGLFLLGHQPAEEDEPPQTAVVETQQTWGAWITSADGSGTHGVFLSRPDGALNCRFLSVYIEEGRGIVDAEEDRLATSELQMTVDRIEGRYGEALPFGPFPVEQAKARLIQAIEDTRANGNRVPSTIAFWSSALTGDAVTGHPVEDVELPAPSPDTELGEALFQRATIGWMYEMPIISPLVKALGDAASSKLEIEEHVKKARYDEILARETESLFNPVVAERYALRLNDLAWLQHGRGNLEGASLSRAAAQDIAAKGPASKVALSLTQKTLVYFLESVKNAR